MKTWRDLVVVDAGGAQVALVADENQILLGTISDGDIRRALLKGRQLSDGCVLHDSSNGSLPDGQPASGFAHAPQATEADSAGRRRGQTRRSQDA
jgi:hypothetical protein